jgi:hypothetical protein
MKFAILIFVYTQKSVYTKKLEKSDEKNYDKQNCDENNSDETISTNIYKFL